MNKEELIKGYTRRSIQQTINTTVKHEKPPLLPTKATAIEAPKPIPFYTVERLCGEVSEIRGFIRTVGYCKPNGAEAELLSHDGKEHPRIVLDFRNAVRSIELGIQAPVPIELAGSVVLDGDGITIIVSFCKNLRDCTELSFVIKYYESISKNVICMRNS